MNVELRKLTLKYFKGKQNLEVNFTYPETVIMGENGTGKSTISDAWHWLLFGKDSQGRSVKTATSDGFELKTLTSDNVVIPNVDHEVIGELYCDGRKVELRKVYKEDWVKPRGALEAVLKGHTNVCYFDGVPVDMGEYNRRVNDIIPEALFKLITNPLYYNQLHWTDRRKVLIAMAGDIKDADIAAINPEFQKLLQSLDGKSIADFKAKIGAEKATIKKEFDLLPTKIATVREGMPEKQDWEALQKELNTLQSEIDEIDIAIGDANKSYQTILELTQGKQRQINQLKTEKQTIEQTARAAEKDRVFEANQKRRDLENEIAVLKRELTTCQTNADALKKERDTVEANLNKAVTQSNKLRDDWYSENSKEYFPGDGCLTCPVYGHECTDGTAHQFHAGAAEKAREAFNQKKRETLATISENGRNENAKIPHLQEQIKAIDSELVKYADIQEQSKIKLDIKMNELRTTPIEAEKEIDITLHPDWIAADLEIKELEAQIEDSPATADNTELIQKKREITAQTDALKKTLNTKEQIANDERRIAEYMEQQRTQAQKIADLEAMEYEAMQFTKAKFAEVENRINSKFKIVQFKMFDYTNDGNEVEKCETLVNGVPYLSINTAGQINAGLDIINAICEYHNVFAPIFIDRRESVNALIPCKSQIINLVVSKEKTLQIN
jgi:DNA repair exonuclease SbcCD ATPase subunit